MPTLPTRQAIGARPIPRSSSRIVSFRADIAESAEADALLETADVVGNAGASLGVNLVGKLHHVIRWPQLAVRLGCQPEINGRAVMRACEEVSPGFAKAYNPSYARQPDQEHYFEGLTAVGWG